MSKEDIDHTKYEGLSRQINIDSRYDCLSPNNKFFQPASFGYSGTSVQKSKQNNWRKFQDYFPISHTHNDHQKLENTE